MKTRAFDLSIQKPGQIYLHVLWVGKLCVLEEVEDKINHHIIIDSQQLVHTCLWLSMA